MVTRKTQTRLDAMCLTDGCRGFYVGEGSEAWAVEHVTAQPDHIVSVMNVNVDLHYTREDDDGA